MVNSPAVLDEIALAYVSLLCPQGTSASAHPCQQWLQTPYAAFVKITESMSEDLHNLSLSM